MPLSLSELYMANAPSEIDMRPFPKVVSEFDLTAVAVLSKAQATIISTMQ